MKDNYQSLRFIGIVLAAIGFGIALAICGISGDLTRFKFSYLASFCAMLSMGVGCLFFVVISHLTRAGWNVTVRRIAEIGSMCIAPMFLLFLPLLCLLLSLLLLLDSC